MPAARFFLHKAQPFRFRNRAFHWNTLPGKLASRLETFYLSSRQLISRNKNIRLKKPLLILLLGHAAFAQATGLIGSTANVPRKSSETIR